MGLHCLPINLLGVSRVQWVSFILHYLPRLVQVEPGNNFGKYYARSTLFFWLFFFFFLLKISFNLLKEEKSHNKNVI